jgi:hypothetical protein
VLIRHASAETIARFRAGELSARRTAKLQAHLAGCVRCAQTSADLAVVSTLLARTQAPPIPEHLSARIQNALAAEAAQRVVPGAAAEADGHAAPFAGAAQPGGSAVPGDMAVPAAGPPVPAHERTRSAGRTARVPRAPRPRLAALASPVGLRVLAAAGALAVAAGGGYALVSQLGAATGTHSRAASASGRKAAEPRAAAGAVTAGSPRAFGPTMHFLRDGRRVTFTPVASSTDFQPQTLAAQANAAISAVFRQKASESQTAPAATNATATGDRPSAFVGARGAQLRACVARLSAGGTVVLVDVAKFRGRPATIIVTQPPRAGSAAAVVRQIYVVGPACSGTRSDLLAHRSVPAR